MLAFLLEICEKFFIVVSRPFVHVFYVLGLTNLIPEPKKESPTSTHSTSAANTPFPLNDNHGGSVFTPLLQANAVTSAEGVLRYPVVIIHGFADRPTVTGIEDVVETALSELGVEYFVPIIEAFGSIFERSKSLAAQIAARFPQGTVHLVAHSMGGLNARDLATKLMTEDLGFKIKTVTTLGTPHRGGKAFDIVPDLDDNAELAVFLRELIGTDLGAVGDMGFDAMAKYNKTHRYNPDVRYFSWAGQIEIPTPIFILTYAISRAYGPTDGLINVNSAMWGPDLGPGTHLGTLQGADHYSLVGRAAILGSIPHLKAAEDGRDAPVISPDNNLFTSISRSVNGVKDTLLGPFRALLTKLRLRGP